MCFVFLDVNSMFPQSRKPKKSSKQSQSGDSYCEEDSSGSFFLHDQSTLSYNRLSDLFPNSTAQTVCSDDSGVGLISPSSHCINLPQITANTTAFVTNKPLSRPKQRPPKPPAPGMHIWQEITFTQKKVLMYIFFWLNPINVTKNPIEQYT